MSNFLEAQRLSIYSSSLEISPTEDSVSSDNSFQSGFEPSAPAIEPIRQHRTGSTG